ncbi:unnamed protein product [Lampetra fluviatilis]
MSAASASEPLDTGAPVDSVLQLPRAVWMRKQLLDDSLGDLRRRAGHTQVTSASGEGVSEPLTADVNCDPDLADPAAKEPAAPPSLILPPGVPTTEEQEAVSVAGPASRTRSKTLIFR